MSDPSCRAFRELLGVYVVGAIEPGERAAVDSHLNQCFDCREELASLAPLPALLHRVPLGDAERIMLGSQPPDGDTEPSPGMLESLLKEVGARRRTRRVRGLFAAAAAVLVAVGGAAAVAEAIAPHHHARTVDIATASTGALGATVRYGASSWGTSMSVQVTGFKKWTACEFYVLTKDGRKILAGGWLVGPDSQEIWYPVHSRIQEANVTGFEITTGAGKKLEIPAA
ncbi:MAG TPA: zf-HC2 domain-containing protein [Streptosporangiaceae bacterium]|nr:zf-HC2 domain-containing protein [Streptosporangiaceae bacterium]